MAALPLLLLSTLVAPACSGSVTREPARSAAPGVAVEEKGEILSEEPFPARDDETAADKVGGTLVAVSLVVAVIAAAVLPLLLFL